LDDVSSGNQGKLESKPTLLNRVAVASALKRKEMAAERPRPRSGPDHAEGVQMVGRTK
jgi:hypothetical protein